jgi:putative oxidoreductase
MSIGLLILRLVVGLTLAAHGAQKLLGLTQTGAAFEQLGFVPGRRAALAAGLAEVGAGLLLALGLATPVAAAIALSVMVVAGVSAHAPKGFFAHNGGYEYTLILGIAALSIAFTGPGLLSLDAVLGVRDAGSAWGLAALVVGLARAGLQLARRQFPAPSTVSPGEPDKGETVAGD